MIAVPESSIQNIKQWVPGHKIVKIMGLKEKKYVKPKWQILPEQSF